MRPERVRRDEARVVGIRAHTSSLREADPATAAVPALWRRFEAGDPPAGLDTVTVPAGDYLVFAARGPMPAALATTWERIAEFFEHAPVSRAFTADLEVHYAAGSAVDVFVAIG